MSQIFLSHSGKDIYTVLEMAPELEADTGQKEKAFEDLMKAEAEFQEMGMGYWLRKTQEVLKTLKQKEV